MGYLADTPDCRHHVYGPWCPEAVWLVWWLWSRSHGAVDGFHWSGAGFADGLSGSQRRILWWPFSGDWFAGASERSGAGIYHVGGHGGGASGAWFFHEQ